MLLYKNKYLVCFLADFVDLLAVQVAEEVGNGEAKSIITVVNITAGAGEPTILVMGQPAIMGEGEPSQPVTQFTSNGHNMISQNVSD